MIRIGACGFETKAEREAIEDDVFWQLEGSWNDENDKIGQINRVNPATARGTFVTRSGKGDYRIRYTIEDR